MTKTQPYRGTQAVLRAIALLKVFTDARPQWGLSDLAQAVGLNKTTTYRLLTALESEELLERHAETDTYRLGLGMISLGGYALRANDLRALCQQELRSLAALAKETAALELLTGAEVLILDEVTGDRVMSGGQAIGTRWPVYATSTGKAMLAVMPTAEVTAVLPPHWPPLTPHTLPDHAALFADFAQTRARGFALADEELEIGLVAVGAPLLDFDGRVVAAISLAGPKTRLGNGRIAEIGPLVAAAARRVSIHLGYAPDVVINK